MSLEQLLELPLFFSRAIAVLIGVVALVTLVLAIAGLYSSVFYSVSQRRQELALRVLLGASPTSILALALRSMAGVALAGALAGVVFGVALLPLVSSLFFGIQPVELSLIIAVAALAIAVVVVTTISVVWPLTSRLTISSGASPQS